MPPGSYAPFTFYGLAFGLMVFVLTLLLLGFVREFDRGGNR